MFTTFIFFKVSKKGFTEFGHSCITYRFTFLAFKRTGYSRYILYIRLCIPILWVKNVAGSLRWILFPSQRKICISAILRMVPKGGTELFISLSLSPKLLKRRCKWLCLSVYLICLCARKTLSSNYLLVLCMKTSLASTASTRT